MRLVSTSLRRSSGDSPKSSPKREVSHSMAPTIQHDRLAQALVVHSEALPTVHADSDVAIPPLKRALALAKDPALRRAIERALRALRD